MSDRTGIEYCDATWNIVTGCTKISEGCLHCFAERTAKRLAGRCGYPKDNPFGVTHHLEKLDLPRRWRKPRRVFVNSMGDLFHPDVSETTLRAIFYEMSAWNLQHTFMILTKRPERMKQIIDQWLSDGVIFRDGVRGRLTNNIWLGVTVELGKYLHRIDELLKINAAVHFVSFEPLLGPVEIPEEMLKRLDWVICGGETGPSPRMMAPEYAAHLWKQSKAAGVPFFFKKWNCGFKPEPEGYGHGKLYAEVEATRQFPEVK